MKKQFLMTAEQLTDTLQILGFIRSYETDSVNRDYETIDYCETITTELIRSAKKTNGFRTMILSDVLHSHLCDLLSAYHGRLEAAGERIAAAHCRNLFDIVVAANSIDTEDELQFVQQLKDFQKSVNDKSCIEDADKWNEFTETDWKIEFGDLSVVIPNSADTYDAICTAIATIIEVF